MFNDGASREIVRMFNSGPENSNSLELKQRLLRDESSDTPLRGTPKYFGLTTIKCRFLRHFHQLGNGEIVMERQLTVASDIRLAKTS